MSKLSILILSSMFAGSAYGEPACTQCSAWNKTQQPFKIYGNTYYVGVHGLTSILIVSDQGDVHAGSGYDISIHPQSQRLEGVSGQLRYGQLASV